MSSFDKQADNLLQLINKEWTQHVSNQISENHFLSTWKRECENFDDATKKEIFPKLAAHLENKREEICQSLQSCYLATSYKLIYFYQRQFLPQNVSDGKSRMENGIEMLCEDEELLEILEPLVPLETRSSSQIAVYEKLCDKPGYEVIMTSLLGDVDRLKMLETHHKSVERALQFMEYPFISCDNHSAPSISRKLRERVKEVKGHLIRCTELVEKIERELQVFFNQAIVTFEEMQIWSGLDLESLPEKVKKINCFMESLEDGKNEGDLLKEMDNISEMIFKKDWGSQQKIKVEMEVGQLETLLESIQLENLKGDILRDVFTSSVHGIQMERLTGLKKLMTSLMEMKDELFSYNFQSNQNSFEEDTLENNCLVNLLDEKFKTRYLSLVKELVNFSNVNTKVELISNKVLQVTGNFVKFSDFVFKEESLRKIDLTGIQVFATQRIFVDEDFYDRLGRELEITLISPSVEVIGKRVISLDGKPGENNFWFSAKSGKGQEGQEGQDGESGLAGEVGGNGGHFYLICEELINAASLTVEVRGGNGGHGQNGGNGCCGAAGRNAQVSDLSKGETYLEGVWGTSGGNGGDGGMGGRGGQGGTFEVVLLENQDGSVKVSRKGGQSGKDGKGGSGGMGGKNGNGIQRNRIVFISEYKCIPCNTRAQDGKPGRDGANSTNIVRAPSPPKKCQLDWKASVISELRKFYMNQSNNVGFKMIRQFLEKIDLKLDLQHLSVKSLAQDLINLELTPRNCHDADFIVREHKAFQSRITRYVDLMSAEKLSGKKHVIKLLYAYSISVLRKYQGYHGAAGASGTQVINLLSYFDVVKDTINQLKESSVPEEVNRREALKTYRAHLKGKCDDTKEFILRVLLPSIAQAKKEIEKEINCCAGEVEAQATLTNFQFWDIIKSVLIVLELGIGAAQWFNGSQFAYQAVVLGIAGLQKWIGIDDGREDGKFPENLQQPNIQLPACLNHFHVTLFEDIVPLVNGVLETVVPSSSSQPQDNLITSNNNLSASRKLNAKWQIRTTLRKFKKNLAIILTKVKSKGRLIQAVKQMEEGLSLLVDLYDMIDNYEESKLFSEALAGIKPIRNGGDSSDELQEILDKIGYLLKANSLILDYNQAVVAFKQWVFPFANKYPVSTLSFESDLTGDLTNLENHVDKLTEEYKVQFETIHDHLVRYKSMKMDLDDVIFRGMFSSRSAACPPFYVWKGEEWGDTIKRFLKGEEVQLRADLMKDEEFTKREMGAVKFKTVQLKIKKKDEEDDEEELDRIMKLFKVSMIHSGISYYQVFDQRFVMRGSRNEYCYSFDGTTKNSTFEKSENQGYYLLSPFTIWKFKLNEILDGGGGFEELNKFEDEVDLELWGDGLYLDEGKAKEKKLDEKYLKDLHLHYELV